MTGQFTTKFIRIGKILLKSLIILLCTIILLVGVLTVIQYFSVKHEKALYPAPGSLVNINGKKMHVYTEGEGKTAFVILSGGGIGAPVLEYKPLWSRFAEHGRVAVVEYMGYGWSDDTDVPRTSENIADEIKAALREADVNPPYVFVVHSIGGIYAMKYAQLYGDDLEAVIALDTTLPRGIIQAKEHGQTVQQSLPDFGTISLLRKTGILRAFLWMNPLLVSGAPQGVYTEEEERMIAMVTSWDYASHAMINEFKTLDRNMTDLIDAEFPKALPVLMIQADPPGEKSETYEWFLSERKRLTESLDHGKVVELPAGHSGIYWTLSDDIVRETLSFLEQASVN
jgi:pimeloyl-ACP methyl ester carboxylesterase